LATWIIGNLLSVDNPDFAHALRVRNPAMVEDLVREQVDTGVGGLLLDVGPERAGQLPAVRWVLQVAQGEATLPLALRTADVEALHLAAERMRRSLIVDATAPTVQDWRPFLEVARARESYLVLPGAPGGQPAEAAARARYIVKQLLPWAQQAGIPPDRLFVDVCPASVARDQARVPAALETMLLLRQALQQPPRLFVHLADVSAGLAAPHQRLIHRTYLTMLLAAGLDAAVVDPRDELLRRFVRLVEQRDSATPIGQLLSALRQAVVAGHSLRPDEVDMRDPEQAAIWKTVRVLRNEVVYSDSYLEG
jgi:5-methyltetrahydrofolate--homocysteine methyltransferase